MQKENTKLKFYIGKQPCHEYLRKKLFAVNKVYFQLVQCHSTIDHCKITGTPYLSLERLPAKTQFSPPAHHIMGDDITLQLARIGAVLVKGPLTQAPRGLLNVHSIPQKQSRYQVYFC